MIVRYTNILFFYNSNSSANIIQSLISKSKHCTLSELYNARDFLHREKDQIQNNINHMQSNIVKIKFKTGDSNAVTNSSSKSTNNISRKRKRKRQQADEDDDFDPIDEDFDFAPRDANGDSMSLEPETPVSAVITTPVSATATGNSIVGRGSKKNSRKKLTKSTTKKNSKKKRKKTKFSKLEDEKDVLDSDLILKDEVEDEIGYGIQGKDVSQIHIQFWRLVDEFFLPVHNDPEKLKLLEPVDIENDEDINEIPELGTHYLQKWMEEKNDIESIRTHPKSVVPSETNKMVDLDAASDFFDFNSITVRLLQSMVEEQDVINIKRKNKKGRPKITRNSKQLIESQSTYKEALALSSEIQQGITACTDDYSTSIMSQVDDRVTHELRMLGLFEDPELQSSDTPTDEGDEVLAEIKRLQKELKDLIEAGNEFRSKIYQAVKEREPEEELLLQRKKDDLKIIKEFERRVFNPRVR